MLLINHTHPYLRIYVEATGEFVQFKGGKLEIEEGDPNYDAVMKEAISNPTIVILEHGVQCDRCGEPFAGKAAKASLGKHMKAVHFDVWSAEQDAKLENTRMVELKARAGFVCDVCRPEQTFPSVDSLAEHARALHASVQTDDEGNVVDPEASGGGGNAAAAPAGAAPAAS